MSLITQCPACHTLFKVVSDQLKISDGWVRCGQCREVFDAQAHWAQGEVNDVLSGQSSAQLETFKATEVSNAEVDTGAEQILPRNEKSPLVPVTSNRLSGYQDFASSDWINSVNPPAPTNPDIADESDVVAGLHLAEMPSAPGNGAGLLSENTDSTHTPAFVKQAQRAERWRTPWARAGLSASALLLLCLMVLQVVYFERDRITAAEPATERWMMSMCRVAGCTVAPLKHIESVVVDASSFNKIRSDGKNELYKITLNLKNTGTLPVAVPHIELSLNDTQDQALLRRVLNPADLGVLQLTLVPRAELGTSASIQIDATQLAGARIAGYRVLAFYP
jgi:predicted Zn finger-like uncharacterized protein